MSGGRKGKAQFYVFYLGWKECRGIRGREFVEPIIRELISRRRNEELPKLTIEATRKELKITQLIEKRKGKVEKLKYPPIPTKDVTYSVQAMSPDEDVVACIYLGYNPQTRAAVHVHVYRCDSPATAGFFVDHLTSFINLPEHQQRMDKIEAELVAKRQVYQSQNTTYGIAASEPPSMHYEREPPNTRYDFHPHDDPYRHDTERRPYASHENLRGPYPDRDRDLREEPLVEVYDDAPAPREDPYTLKNYRRELNNRRKESPTQNGAPVGKSVFAPNFPVNKRETVEPYNEQEEVYQSVTAELKAKLQGKSGEAGPLLLPVKDYDTLRLTGSNLQGIEDRRSSNKHITGASGRKEDDHSSEHSDQGVYEYNNPHREVTYQKWKESTARPAEGYHGGRARSPDVRRPYGHPTRAASPEPRRHYQDDWGRQRGRSPTRGHPPLDSHLARAMSPPPGHELRNTYFPNDDMLPNYLDPSSDYGYAAQITPARRGGSPNRRALSPSRRALSPNRRPASPVHSRYSAGSDDRSRKPRNPKYTATRLGLNQGGYPPQKHARGRPRSDEGYLSMDRQNPYQQHNDPYKDHHAPGGYPRNESPPFREVIAGDVPHRELIQAADPSLPGSTQSFLY